MATLRDIRGRIKGAQSTQKITKAMKMVAAAKLRRAQEAIINARPFAAKIGQLLNNLITDEDRAANPFLIEREGKNALVVVLTADRGLCGSFNTNLIKEAARMVDDELKSKGYTSSLYCIGKKGYEFFRKRNYSIAGHHIGLFKKLKFDAASSVSDELIELFISGKFDKVYVVTNEFKSVVSQKVITEQYLPVAFPADTAKKENRDTWYIYEENQQSIFQQVLPQYLKTQLWRFFLESNASEFGAKMTAMENATINAGELIRGLKVKYNKERQAAITKEILEIVSGSNALKKS